MDSDDIRADLDHTSLVPVKSQHDRCSHGLALISSAASGTDH